LIELLWRAAPSLSLAHDAAEGGLAVALAEAAIFSGVGAEVSLPGDELELFGEGGGRIVVATAESPGLTRIGTVGGGTVLGIPLTELAAAWRTG
jgi:phosphoribosylformylglycinamidine (FGAM) synthase-like enzyme